MRKLPFKFLLAGCLGTFMFVQQATAQKPDNKKQQAIAKEDDTQKKTKLITILKELNKQKGIFFLMADPKLGNTQVYYVNYDKENVDRMLSKLLKNTGITYKQVDKKTFVILPEGDKSEVANINPLDVIQNTPPSAGNDYVNIYNADFRYSITKGKVLGADGSVISGASVIVKGTKRGTSTDNNGNFEIDASNGDVLMISSIGFETKEITVSSTNLTVTLAEGTKPSVETVVVTALGITRQAKSLTYSVQKVSNSDLTTVKDASVVNSLTGKVAGVTITKSSSGIGGSTRVILRGNKSTRNNQPLYVIDGVPMTNSLNTAQPGDEYGQSGVGFVGVDGGDGISNINPEDIESISVLKGASAAALYGSQAASGVILITTKKGRAGVTRVDVSSSVFLDSRMYKTPIQFKYGQTSPPSAGNPGSLDSWGNTVNAPNHVDDFFQTGVTSFNSIALSGGTTQSQSYLSYSFTDNKGIVPTVTLEKHNINFRQTNKFFGDRLTTDVNVLYINQKSHNRPPSGFYDNPLSGLYLFPRGLNFNKYKQYEVFSSLRNTYVQNWWDANYDSTGGYNGGNSANEQNPYWILNRTTSDNILNRVYTNISLNYKINDWLNVQARGNIDKSINDIDLRSYATTSTVLTANNGGYAFYRGINTQLYGDLIMSANKKLSTDLSLSASVGTSINDSKVESSNFGTRNSGDGLRFANVFQLANILPEAYTVTQSFQHRQVQAVFGTAQLNLKDYLYLDLTARNDWSSTFAFTPSEKSGYFYYSAGLTGVLSSMFKLPDAVTFSKLRASYAKVGNDVNVYSTNPSAFTINNQNGSTSNTKGPKPGTYLQPEMNTSFEVGTEWRFLNDRLGFDFTYYENNNKRQYVETPASAGSGLSTWYLNTGNIRNRGVELSINITPLKSKNFTWNSTINYAFNQNKVIQIADPSLGVSQTYFTLTGIGNLLYASYIKQGGSWGDIYGHFFQRGVDGSIVVDATGAPKAGVDSTKPVGDQNLKVLGNPNPRFTLGWNNTINIKNFTLGFLFDGRFGGQVMSMTQAILDANGISQASQDARDAGGVKMMATTDATKPGTLMTLNPKNFYIGVGGQSGISEYYMYDATNIRLREASLSYKIPVNAKWVRQLTVSVIGRNLFFVTKKAPFDPEVSMSTNNGLQGVETFGLPSTRSVGASIKLGF